MNALVKIDNQAKLRSKLEDKNIPFTSAEIQESKVAGSKLSLMNLYENRRSRRAKEDDTRILNNRKQTSGRKGQKVLIKMSYFSLALYAKRNRL